MSSLPFPAPDALRVAFLLGRAGSGRAGEVSALTLELVSRLQERGVVVDLIEPEDDVLELAEVCPRHDLYVLKDKTPLTLSLAGALTQAGAAILNSFASASLARDKVAATLVLAGSGLPVPPSWATGRVDLLRPLLQEGALWLKPHRGSQGLGVARITDPADLARRRDPTDAFGLPLPLFAQHEVASTGRDLKVYVVGDAVWAITRTFPARTLQDKLGTPAELAPEIRDAALACGRALGLELFGADFLVGDGSFFVVDVNGFPGYKGVAQAPAALAEYIHQRARRARDGDRP